MSAQSDQGLDDLDIQLIRIMREEPRIGMLEVSRRLGVARGTVNARLDRLRKNEVVTGFGPEVDLKRIGYSVLAFSILELAQGRIGDVRAVLDSMPEVLEAHTVAGRGDVIVRLIARSNDHLMELIEQIVGSPHIARAETMIALAEQVPYRPLSVILP